MTKQNGNRFDREWALQGSPTNTTFVETVSRTAVMSNCAIGATGVAHATRVPVNPGDVLSSITFIIATTAAGTPTAGYAAVRNSAGTVVAQTADFASTARAANTAYTVAFATPYLVTEAGLYYVEISFTATTVPTLAGVSLHNAAVSTGSSGIGQPVLAVTHGSGVGATPPATVATPTASASIPYLVLT